jgi:hypothetical protein
MSASPTSPAKKEEEGFRLGGIRPVTNLQFNKDHSPISSPKSSKPAQPKKQQSLTEELTRDNEGDNMSDSDKVWENKCKKHQQAASEVKQCYTCTFLVKSSSSHSCSIEQSTNQFGNFNL